MNDVAMFNQMLIMQDEINTIVNPDWRHAKYEWHRAVWIECAELIEHHGFKWWKQQKPEWNQITLEIVDIWHFGMSMLLSMGLPLDKIAEDLALHYNEVLNNEESEPSSFIEKVEVLAGTATTGIFDTISFFDVMLAANIDLDLLFSMYVGKNVLNKFRQANGYKEGTYHKEWFDGREDNEHLTDIMNQDTLKLLNDIDLIQYVLSELQLKYDTILTGTLVNGELVITSEFEVQSNGY